MNSGRFGKTGVLLKILIPVVSCILLIPAGVAAQQPADKPPESAAAQPAYPETPEGLRDLMATLLAKKRARDSAWGSLVQDLIMPSDSSWFDDTFGQEDGALLSKAYRESLTNFRSSMENPFRHCAEQDLRDIQVERVDTGPAAESGIGGRIAARMKRPVSMYRVAFRNGATKATSQNYVYADGGFRYVSDGVFVVMPIVPQTRIRLSEEAAMRNLVHRVKPVVPEGIRNAGGDDRVVLSVLIDPDGVVQELEVKHGDAVRAEAAMNAVRQWKFEPLRMHSHAHIRLWVDTEITLRITGN